MSDWLSIQEAADALGLHDRTVWKMVRSGELPWLETTQRRHGRTGFGVPMWTP